MPTSLCCIGKACEAANIDNADYANTLAGVTAAGTCGSLFVQSPRPLRKCLITGEWSDDVTNPCVPVTCPALDSFNGNVFSSVVAGTTNVEGSCAPGYQKDGPLHPTMDCSEDGTWSGTVSNACVQKKCASTTEGGASWPEAAAGESQVLGECDGNHRLADGVPSYRSCSIDGVFEAIKNPCIRTHRGRMLSPHRRGVLTRKAVALNAQLWVFRSDHLPGHRHPSRQ